MTFDTALDYVLAGRSVLFVGAGFSTGAVNLRNAPFKTATGLAAHLAAVVGLDPDSSLEDVAEWVENKKGQNFLYGELQQEYTAAEVAQSQIDTLALNWKRVYTTNYDNVAETAATKCGKRLTPATLSDKIRDLPTAGTLCVHLNGFIDRIKLGPRESDIKLTDTSYLTQTVIGSPWAETLRQDFDAARAVIFIGYSMSDIDMRRLLYERPSLKEKFFFVVAPDIGTLSKHKLERFGTVLSIGIEGFTAAAKAAAEAAPAAVVGGPLNFCGTAGSFPRRKQWALSQTSEFSISSSGAISAKITLGVPSTAM